MLLHSKQLSQMTIGLVAFIVHPLFALGMCCHRATWLPCSIATPSGILPPTTSRMLSQQTSQRHPLRAIYVDGDEDQSHLVSQA